MLPDVSSFSPFWAGALPAHSLKSLALTLIFQFPQKGLALQKLTTDTLSLPLCEKSL